MLWQFSISASTQLKTRNSFFHWLRLTKDSFVDGKHRKIFTSVSAPAGASIVESKYVHCGGIPQ